MVKQENNKLAKKRDVKEAERKQKFTMVMQRGRAVEKEVEKLGGGSNWRTKTETNFEMATETQEKD
jgi:hypothetical protein